MSKPRLVLISDIYGNTTDNWMEEYRKKLTPYFEVIEYDSRVLAGITSLDQKEVHSEFINGGTERAVQNLLTHEPKASIILGFSIGGTIAWKFATENNKITSLHLVSATRLRNEITKPSSKISLYYGELEANGPTQSWFENFKLVPTIFDDQTHECYSLVESAKYICTMILSEII